jgi:hypothetical protein
MWVTCHKHLELEDSSSSEEELATLRHEGADEYEIQPKNKKQKN